MSSPVPSSAVTESAPASVSGGKRNKWLTHVKKTMKSHKGQSFKSILKAAKKSYKGGEESEGSSEVEGGRRRRKSRKTRRSRKH